MGRIDNYTIIEKIDETFNATAYRARQDSVDEIVVIKVLKSGFFSLPEIARLKKEFELIRKFSCSGIIKPYEILEYDGKLAVVMEDFHGIPLNKAFTHTSISLKQFLEIAIDLSETLGYLHRNNIVHQDIKPRNILINNTDLEIKISDFGISTYLNRLNGEIYRSEIIKYMLAYVSPEQTGRINRQVDYRTDLYSLGVTFYEILTGRLPFMSSDPMEVIHAHIARKPVPPDHLNPKIPAVVSDIILKLMSKTAEERYQNSFGLMADLKHCLEAYKARGEVPVFELGHKDISLSFNFSQKLYGREEEIRHLTTAYNLINNGGSGIMLISGNPGIGKTALIHDFHKTVMENRGFFISGKYEELMQDVPYSAITQAFQGLIKQILSENKEVVEAWKEKLLNALTPNEAIITHMIPDVAHIIGSQPKINDPGSEEFKNRFTLAFKNFTRVFAGKMRPLVLFLDDVHWADHSSLQLIKSLLADPEETHVLVIAAFRGGNIADTHPLRQCIHDIKQNKIFVRELHLNPLSSHHINSFIQDFFKSPGNRSKPLANLVLKKTGGNPFFIHQFMKTLHDRKLLQSDTDNGWQWDFDQIRQLDLTDNVVDLLSEKIVKLPEGRCELLKIGACIGHTFDLERLSAVIKQPMDVIWGHVREAINEGYIEIHEDKLRFQHDRIREAAYQLIPEDKQREIHYCIGKYTLDKTGSEDFSHHLFYIADQLNHAGGMHIPRGEQYKLAHLNLKAGEKAINSAAYSSALVYFEHGIGFLEEDSWTTEYGLSLRLYEGAVAVACLNGNFDRMYAYGNIALNKAKTILDQITIYEFYIWAQNAQNNLVEAVRTGLAILKQLGITFPETPGKWHLFIGMIRVKLALRGKKIEELIHLPEMKDPKYLAAMRIIAKITAPAYNSNLLLAVLIQFENLLLSIRYGNTPDSALAYAVYAINLCMFLQGFDNADKFCDLSLNLLEKFNSKELKAQVITTVHGFVKHWTEPAVDSMPPLLEGYQSGKEAGTLLYSANCLFLYCGAAFFMGKELSVLNEELTTYVLEIRQMNQEPPLIYTSILKQVVLNLRGMTKEPCRLTGDFYNESEMLPKHHDANDFSSLAYFYSNKMFLTYLFGDFQNALANDRLLKTCIDGVRSSMSEKFSCFYSALIHCAVYPQSKKSHRKKILKEVVLNKKKLKKYQSLNSDHHMKFAFALVTAEHAGILGDYKNAVIHYEKALNISRESGITYYEALVNELTARFYLSNDQENLACYYIQEARYKYGQWGAVAKVNHIDVHYAKILAGYKSVRNATSQSAGLSTTGGLVYESSPNLDLSTVIKASEAIFGEIVLSKLLKRLMKILIENAGAEKGFIILRDGDRLLVEAEGNTGAKEIRVLSSIPLDRHDGLSSAIAGYTARMKETVILHNAVSEGSFTWDPYVIKNKSKSILCMPILNQGRLSAILYLENNLATNAFTPEQLKILNMLCSQIAVSIDNAKLYENLEQKVEERTAQLKKAQEENLKKAHRAGMADIAKETLHNVGNILNSIKTVADTVNQSTRKTALSGLISANFLLRNHMDNLHHFILYDPKGSKLMDCYLALEQIFREERDHTDRQIQRLREKVDEIVRVIHTLQGHIGCDDTFLENVTLRKEVQFVLSTKREMLYQDRIEVVEKYDKAPMVRVQKAKLAYVLDNLIINSKEAMENAFEQPKILHVEIAHLDNIVRLSFSDNGEGISGENIKKIFFHGFTTKKGRIGHNLHNCANNMTEMGGVIRAESRGEGLGATFILEFPAVYIDA